MKKVIIIIVSAMSVLVVSCDSVDSMKARTYVKRYVESSCGGKIKSFAYTPYDIVYTYENGMEYLDEAFAELGRAKSLTGKSERSRLGWIMTGSEISRFSAHKFQDEAEEHLNKAKTLANKAISVEPVKHNVRTASVSYVTEDGKYHSEIYVLNDNTLTVKCPVSEFGVTKKELGKRLDKVLAYK